MGYVQIGSKAVGSIVKIKENGTPVNYIIVHQGLPGSMYDASCNGTWVWREDILDEKYPWSAGSYDDPPDIQLHLDNTVINRYDANIKNAIKQVKIPYGRGPSRVYSGADGRSCKLFLLGGYEIGWRNGDPIQRTGTNRLLKDGDKLDYFLAGVSQTSDLKRRIIYETAPGYWAVKVYWTRTPGPIGEYPNNEDSVWVVYGNTPSNPSQLGSSGMHYYITGETAAGRTEGVRPAFILPPTLLVGDDGTVTANTAPSVPGSVTIPGSISGGTNITVKWAASTDPQGNLAGYKVERSTNGGSAWAQIYQGPATQTTDNVAFGTPSVVYRVLAYDTEGLASGWRTSDNRVVINNRAPSAPGGLTVPSVVKGGSNLPISWTAASDSDSNLSGYELERSVGGGAWAQIYRGSALAYTDAITKGWVSVAYRVRAYDAYNAYSSYVTSPTRTVDNNTAPVVTSATASGTDLGTKQDGFNLSYSVSDANGDTVTVNEYLDGAVVRTYQATLGQSNTVQCVTAANWQTVLNGRHTIKVTAHDGKADSAPYTVTFTKAVYAASVTLAEPLEADDTISLMVLNVLGAIPADANLQVLVTNNARDAKPVWEDATRDVKNGSNHIFTNQTATNGFAFNFKVSVSRGPSNTGGYITSIGGAFQ